MFKHTYDSMNRVIVPSRELEQATLEQMAARRAGGRMPRRPVKARRFATVAVALVLVCALSVTAFAAVPGLGGFFAQLLPAWQEQLAPTATSGEPAASQGITLNVPAAFNDGDSAGIFFTLTDQEGGRLSDTTRVAGTISGEGWEQGFSAAPVYFEEETRTATYRCDVTRPGALDGAALNLTVTELLGGKNQQELALPLDSLTITEPAGTTTYTLDVEEDLLAQTWEARYTALVKDGSMTFLAPGEPQALHFTARYHETADPTVEGVTLTGASYLDGQLHLQFHLENGWKSALRLDGGTNSDPDYEPNSGSYGGIAWENSYRYENGQITNLLGNGEFYQNGAPVMGNEYVELIYNIPQEKLGYETLHFTYTTYNTALSGEWSQDFTLQSAGDTALELTGPYNVQVETKHLADGEELAFTYTYSDAVLDSIRVTPLGITVTAAATPEEETPQIDGVLKRIAPAVSKLNVSVTLTSGEEVAYALDPDGYSLLPDGNGNMTARYETVLPVDTAEIASLTVNGVEVPVA